MSADVLPPIAEYSVGAPRLTQSTTLLSVERRGCRGDSSSSLHLACTRRYRVFLSLVDTTSPGIHQGLGQSVSESGPDSTLCKVRRLNLDPLQCRQTQYTLPRSCYTVALLRRYSFPCPCFQLFPRWSWRLGGPLLVDGTSTTRR